MNDTTLPIPSNPSKRAKPRRRPKAGVQRGFGLHDWMTLLRRAKDLAQRRGEPVRRGISLAEVKLHDKPHDGWMVLRGKVYNITPYLAYHPGGSDIVEKCCGKDATKLFDKYHSWVNLDGLIGPLLLGYLKLDKIRGSDQDDANDGGYSEGAVDQASRDDFGDQGVVVPAGTTATSSAATANGSRDLGFAMPKPRPPKGKPMASLLPRDDEEAESEEDAFLF